MTREEELRKKYPNAPEGLDLELVDRCDGKWPVHLNIDEGRDIGVHEANRIMAGCLAWGDHCAKLADEGYFD